MLRLSSVCSALPLEATGTGILLNRVEECALCNLASKNTYRLGQPGLYFSPSLARTMTPSLVSQ